LAKRRPLRPPLRLWGVATVVGVLVAVPLSSHVAREPQGVPSLLAADLARLPEGTRILVDGDTSGWLLFAVPTLAPVFDMRIESYNAPHVEGYIRTVAAEPGWRDFLARTGAEAALVPETAPIRAALIEQAGWSERSRDAGMVLIEARP
jgi:hypothetical protein